MWGWLISFLVNAALSWALRPDLDDILADSDGTSVNKASNLSQIPVIYGQRKVGGTRVFVETSGADNKYLYIALVLCEGEVEEIGDIYINDIISTDSKFNGLLTINKHLGADNQSADLTLLDAPSWTGEHQLLGVAYLGIRLEWDRDVFGSIPNFQVVVKGRKVFDPRNNITAYSDNPALCLLDYLKNARYGKGLANSAFESDLASWKIAADACDNDVSATPGVITKNFQCNTVLKTDKNVMQNVKVLLSGMRGILPYTQGVYKIVVERAGLPSFSFTESHIIDGINFEGEKKSNRFNRVIATFVNPNNNWQDDQVEYPDAGSTEYTDLLQEDAGFDLENRVNLPTITNVYQAKHIAQTILLRSRQGIVCSFVSTAEALQVAVGDIVTVTHSTPGWDAKHFRVADLSLENDGSVRVVLSEHQNAFYVWNTTAVVPIIPDTNLPNPYLVSAPTNLAVNSGENFQVTNDDGSTSPRVYLSWDASDDSFVDYYVVQIATTNGVWDIEHRTDSSPLYVSGVASGTTIDVRIKAINAMGISSAWVTLNNHTIVDLEGGGSGGVTTFSSNSAPTADLELGDLWFDTTNGDNTLHRWDGREVYSIAGWEALQDGSIPTGALASLDNVTEATISLTNSQLSDITSDIGTINAGVINVGESGVVIRSAVSGSRIEINARQLLVYETTGGVDVLRVKLGYLGN